MERLTHTWQYGTTTAIIPTKKKKSVEKGNKKFARNVEWLNGESCY